MTSPDKRVLDLEGAVDRLALPPAVLAGILGDFRAKYAGVTAEIAGLIEAGDTAEAGRRAHNLKGLAATLGAVLLQAPAAELEAAVDAGDSARTAAALEALAGPMAAAVAEIDAWIQANG
jgi:two-component system sensor histidine kinase/response regulator